MNREIKAKKVGRQKKLTNPRPGFRVNQEMFREYGNGNCNKG